MVEVPKNVENYLTIIRDRQLSVGPFRSYSLILADWLTDQLLNKIPLDSHKDIVPIIIFRASLVFMPSILRKLPTSSVGFMGIRRDEKTAAAHLYYNNLPRLSENSRVVIFDPMLGTCGTLIKAVNKIYSEGAKEGYFVNPRNIYYVGFLAARYGYDLASKLIPEENMFLLAVDPDLDSNYYIYPGIGDFGDRFCGD